MIEVFVSRLGRDSASDSHVVVLQERNGARLLPIWIGQSEAESIVYHIHNVKRPRPITHDLVQNLIVAMGARLRAVRITRIQDRTYIAEMELQHGSQTLALDARPSDSIAIALRLSAPIYAAEELLMEPGDALEREEQDDAPELASAGAEDIGAVSSDDFNAEQLKKYLEALRPEDFGKFNP